MVLQPFFTCAHLWSETTVTHEETEARVIQHHQNHPRADGGMTLGDVVAPAWAPAHSVPLPLRAEAGLGVLIEEVSPPGWLGAGSAPK